MGIMNSLSSAFSNIANSIRYMIGEDIPIQASNMTNVINNISSEDINQYQVLVNVGGTLYNNYFRTEYITGINTNNIEFIQNFNTNIKIGSMVVNLHHMMNNCYDFNQPVILPDNVYNCFYTFSDCYKLNQPITIPDGLVTATGMFSNCYNLNTQISDLPNSLKSSGAMFKNCKNILFNDIVRMNSTNTSRMFESVSQYNSETIIRGDLLEGSYMFNGCNIFNRHVEISGNFNYAPYMFSNTIFNQHLTKYPNSCYMLFADTLAFNRSIPTLTDNITNCYGMFSQSIFNQDVNTGNLSNITGLFFQSKAYDHSFIIKSNVTNCSDLFKSSNFNNSVLIESTILNKMIAMFNGCKFFNKTITMPQNSSIDCAYMFFNCPNFNSTVTFPSGSRVNNAKYMFAFSAFNQVVNLNLFNDCTSLYQSATYFNRPITIPYSVTCCNNMFTGCYNFNQNMVIPDHISKASNMFMDCTGLNGIKNFTFGVNCNNFSRMFQNASNFGGDIYIYNNGKLKTDNMFYTPRNNSIRLNIHINSNNIINFTASMFNGDPLGVFYIEQLSTGKYLSTFPYMNLYVYGNL